ncbi:hypothetical protein DMC30DRAFT_420200 [Rhodotorula diobovata]|uniref:Uncharacterized protein n=1 Tax=Rhodotorula diobovata TaxID=5288 RepID=A0A5C5FLX7_9BASI|nr:hypothetical protein DMC30DRAFT_420200 [Rhodotorula diobovata]
MTAVPQQPNRQSWLMSEGAELQPISVLAPMQLLSMDYFLFPLTSGFKAVLVVVDYFRLFT